MPADEPRQPAIIPATGVAIPVSDPAPITPELPTGQRARSLPRPLRWLAHLWWKTFSALFLFNYAPGAFFTLVRGGPGGLGTYLNDNAGGLLTPLEQANAPVFWSVGTALTLLALLGFLEERAEKRRERAERAAHREAIAEAKETAQAAHQAAVEVQAAVPELVRQEVAAARSGEQAPAPPQGPPFDEALLLAPARFIGRGADLAWVLERLRQGGATGISGLNGLGGIGKTALAAEAIRILRAEGRFPDGIAVVRCAGLTDATVVLQQVLARFDPLRKEPTATDAAGLAEAAHALLDGKDALVVLDNVEPGLAVADVVAPLRAAGAALLLTARATLPDAAVPPGGARMLDLLPEDEALDLFASYYGRNAAADLTAAEQSAATGIVRALGRHTLAITLAAAYARDTHRDVEQLADELADPQRALKLPQGDAPDGVRLSFALSVNALPAEARRLFAALATFATNAFGRGAALALGAGIGLADPEPSLDLLVRRALLQAETDASLPAGSDRERLALHLLLRAFAADEFAAWPDPSDRDGAARALAVYYAGYVDEIADLAKAPDEGNLTAALEWAHAHDEDALVSDLSWGMAQFWRDRGRTGRALAYLPWGIQSAERVASQTQAREDRLQAARLTSTYGNVLQRSGRLREAEEIYQQNLLLRRELSDRRGEGIALSNLGQIALSRGQLDAAADYFAQSLLIDREVQDRQGEGVVLSHNWG